MSSKEENIYIEYDQLPIPIICFNKHIKINYLNSDAKNILKKINTFECSCENNENSFAIPIWLNIKTQEFIKSEYKRLDFIKKIEAQEKF
jgi:hypothetical protein